MTYRFLKFFLYLILVICIFWGALIFSGPRLIKYAANHYFGTTVKISGLEVSPKLRIYAARVDYVEADFGDLGPFTGYSRAVSLRIDNFIGLNPRLHVSIGPSEVNSLFQFNELISEIFYSQNEDKDNLKMLTHIKDFKSKDLVFGHLKTEMMVDTKLSRITSLKYDIQNVETALAFNITAPNITGEVVDLVFDGALVQTFQIASNKTETLYVADSPLGDQLSFKNVSAAGNYIDEVLKYSVTIGEVVTGSNDTLAKGVSVASNYFATVEKPGVRSEFKIDSLHLDSIAAINDGGSIANIVGAAKFQGSNLQSIQVDGLLHPMILQNRGSFLAEIPAGRLTVNSEFPTIKANGDVDMEISLDSSESSNLLIKANLNASFGQNNVMTCITSGCQVSEFVTRYSVDAKKSTMTGRLYCKTVDCSALKFAHRIETQNTAEFFDAISAANLINPMLLAYTFSEIMRGQKNGNGHIKEF